MKVYKFHAGLLLVGLLVTSVGCGSSGGSGSNPGGGASMDEMAGAVDQQNAARKQAADAAAAKAAEAVAATQPPAEPERKVAGREGVAPGGYANAIIGARRHILNKVESLAWIQAVQHFQATEGRLPKDHAEFMNKIVIPLQIDLGHIEEGQEFLYDPKGESDARVGQLYVVEKSADSAAK
jgi:hypothetical protein